MNTAEQFTPNTDENHEPAVDRVARAAHETVDRAAGAAHATAESVSAQAARVQAAQREALDGVGQFVKDKPLQSLGIALATGFVLARILNR